MYHLTTNCAWIQLLDEPDYLDWQLQLFTENTLETRTWSGMAIKNRFHLKNPSLGTKHWKGLFPSLKVPLMEAAWTRLHRPSSESVSDTDCYLSFNSSSSNNYLTTVFNYKKLSQNVELTVVAKYTILSALANYTTSTSTKSIISII